jgi:hypothetical protein
LLPILALALSAGCQRDIPTSAAPQLESQASVLASAWSEWSEPVKLGPPINIPVVRDGNAILSPDGFSLYFDSDRTEPGAQGAGDMWVSRRACTNALDPECAWQTPVNLGSPINTPYVDGGPTISADGHLLFFLSHRTRPDCPAEPNEPDPTRPCDADSFVSWRSDPNDDLGWGPPVPLPHPVNTSDEDNVAAFVSVGEPGRGNLYFNRLPAGAAAMHTDIYYVSIAVKARGARFGPTVQVLGPVVALDEINLANTFDVLGSIRRDGKELFFFSSAPARGGVGGLDIYTSTRRSPHDAWGPPTNVTELNSTRADLAPQLSHDGHTLVLTSAREIGPCLAAGLPGNDCWDIYMSTRTRLPQ